MSALTTIRRLLRGRRGTAAIEFAFVVGPLMLLIFGSIEVSRLVWVQDAVHELAISGARCMGIKAANCAKADVVDKGKTTAYIQKMARSWGLTIAASDIVLNEAKGCGETADFSSVVISYQFTSVLTLLTGPELVFEACFPNQI